jgi:L-ascorbate metabolism protein UlaG (beta-lactamase superfamily)
MKILKFGHSCFLVDIDGVRILFDPGSFSKGQNEVKNLNAVFITHSHPDHFDIDSLNSVRQNNPEVKIYTNAGVGEKLVQIGISYVLAEDGWVGDINGVKVEAYGKEHCMVHKSISLIPNTGYFVAEKLFYPGDCLTDPGKEIEILALPITAPWSKVSETVDYLELVKPEKSFPVHDGLLSENGMNVYQNILKMFAEKSGVTVLILPIKEEVEI